MARPDRALAALALLALATFACVVGPGCEAGTGGRRVTFDVAVVSAHEKRAPVRFQTATGWDVTLDEACVALGPFTLWENAGALVRLPPLRRRLYDLLVPSAHAHAGTDHFHGGQVHGEWVGQLAIDLTRSPSIELGRVEGIAGIVRSASVELHPLREGAIGDVACLRGHQVYAVGSAEKDGAVIAFEGGLDIENEGTLRIVPGIPVDAELDDGVRISFQVDPRAWFAEAQFDRLTETSAEGRALITPDSQVRTAWFIGARGASAFAVRAEPPR
jgi:hypothetical protein